MTLNDMVQAAAVQLKELWPERKVRCGEIPRDADESFFVGVTDSGQGGGLDRRQHRSLSMQVLYFLKGRDTLDYLEWAETMYDGFRRLDVDGRTFRLTNCKARPDNESRYYQFLFDLDLHFVEAGESRDVMEKLILEEALE